MNKRLSITVAITALLLTSCNKPTGSNAISSTLNSSLSYGFTLKELGNNVDFHTELQAKYIAQEDYSTTMGIASGSTAKEYPLPIELSWEENIFSDELKDLVTFTVKLYEGSSTTPFKTYTTKERKVDVYNLKVNTSYSYDVFALYGDVAFQSEKSSFKTTEKGPRNLYVENVMNIRDLGGNGIKQGLIYRSGRFNESDGTTKITENTIDTMINDLGVKTELDLRRPDEQGEITASPLGDSVQYVHLPMYYGGENVLTYADERNGVQYDNPARIKEFFDLLANANNYPVDFHCAIGKDRTGCMAYLIEALCGVSEENIYRDYLFSNFAKISGMCDVKDIDDRYGATIKAYEGDSLQNKVYHYLNEVIGVSETNLKAIQDILIEK